MRYALVICGLLMPLALAQAQTAPEPPLSCEQQVMHTYQSFQKAKVVPEAPGASWNQMLDIIGDEVRALKLDKDLTEQRASNLQTSTARLAARLQQLQGDAKPGAATETPR